MNLQLITSNMAPVHSVGRGAVAANDSGSSLQYLVYLPNSLNRDLDPIVFVHGYKRRADMQVEQLKMISDITGRALLAPCFTKEQHRRYQRLGKGTDGLRADRYFDACLEDVTARYDLKTEKFLLIGYSGGAQFGHRYAMVHPHRVTRLIAIAAGWYTYPDAAISYPHGLATAGKLRAVSINPEVFLRIPMNVLVGANDLDSVNLRRNSRLDKQQGKDRVERARRWVLAMRMAARLYRVDVDISYQEVPGIGHSFEQFVEQGYLRELVLAVIKDDGNDDRDLKLASQI